MYNNNIKEEYLSKLNTSSEYMLRNIFNKSESYEEGKGKDICDFIENEIIEFLHGLFSSSSVTLLSYVSMLRTYTQWCCDNNINADHINHFDMITVDMVNSCINKMIMESKYISLEELENTMEDIVNVCDKALIYALFYGICGEDCIELTNITTNDINFTTQEIKLCTGRTIKAPAKLCYLLGQSCNTYDYILTRSSHLSSLPFDQADETSFKKRANARFSTQERAKLRVVARLGKLREYTGNIALSIDRLKNSGMIHHMETVMREKEISKEDIFNSQEMKEIQKYYNCEHVKPFTLKARYKDFL
jgi:hypothetical protein